MKKIKQGGIQRRISVGLAGLRGGVGLLSSKAGGLFLEESQKKAHAEQALAREAGRFAIRLGELKGAYVKIGQMLALYGEHLLPKPVTSALHTLEANTQAIAWEAVSPNIDIDLTELEVESEAFAAASIAQVHLAKKEGQILCLKIQYPGIQSTIKGDFNDVIGMLNFARWIDSGKQVQDFLSVIRNFLLDEVDYQKEFDKAKIVGRFLAKDHRFHIPKYYSELSSTKVLTMDFVNGYEVTHSRVQGLSQARRNKLAKSMLDLFFIECFELGWMQTDPNFGNYRIVIDESGGKDKLALLDFGAVHSLSEKFQSGVKSTIFAAICKDESAVIDGLIDLNCLRVEDSELVKNSFADFCIFLLEPFRRGDSRIPEFAIDVNGDYDWKRSNLLRRAGKHAGQNMLVKGFSVPPAEFMLMARKLTGVFTFITALNAKFWGSDVLDPGVPN